MQKQEKCGKTQVGTVVGTVAGTVVGTGRALGGHCSGIGLAARTARACDIMGSCPAAIVVQAVLRTSFLGNCISASVRTRIRTVMRTVMF